MGVYPTIRRGGKGVIDIKTTERNGGVVASKIVEDEDEVMIVTANGIMIRMPVKTISQIGRNTQGVRVINLDDGDRVIDMTRVVQEEEEFEAAEEDAEGGDAPEAASGSNGNEPSTDGVNGDGAESQEVEE